MPENQVTVSVEWLAEHINDDNVVVVDGSWHLPTANRDPAAEFLEEHISGAVFFDLVKQSDPNSYMGMMMPPAMHFGRHMGNMGISDQDIVVIYDTPGMFSAGRVWWMFRQFGAAKSYVLDGGLPAWKKAGHAVESGEVTREPRTFKASLSDEMIIALDEMREAVENKTALILDARDEGRFNGTAPEPRADLASGHMPGAKNLPFTDLLDDEKKLLPADQLQAKFDAIGFDPTQPCIATCGSGVTACVVLMGLARLGHHNVPLYDGSWSEWGADRDLPVEI